MSAPIRVTWGSNRACCTIVFRTRTTQCGRFGAFVGESLEIIDAIPCTFHLRTIRARVAGKSMKTIKFLFFCFVSCHIHLRLMIEIGRASCPNSIAVCAHVIGRYTSARLNADATSDSCGARKLKSLLDA